jgi:hypothetical protein
LLGSVFSKDLYIWNSGTQSIRENQILTALSISPTSQRTEILRIDTASTRPDVVTETANTKSTDEGNVTVLNFRILEPGDGILLSLLMDGDIATKIDFQGTIEGSPEIRVTPSLYQRVSKGIQLIPTVFLGTFALVAIAIVAIAALSVFAFLFKRYILRREETFPDFTDAPSAFVLFAIGMSAIMTMIVLLSSFAMDNSDIMPGSLKATLQSNALQGQ